MSDPGRLHELRRLVHRAPASAPSISSWSVGMHLHHCGLATVSVLRALADSTPPPPGRVTLVGRLVLLTGRIPRGRGQAPEIVMPRSGVPTDELERLLDEAQTLFGGRHSLDRDTWLRHPYFGVLNRDRALRFVEVHNAHHLRIVADVLRSAT